MVARAIESPKSSSKPPYGGRTRCALADAASARGQGNTPIS